MKKNVLPSKLNLESPVPGAESAFEEVHRRCNGKLSPGDVALLQFALCAELVESDLWTQYAELGGVGRSRLVYTISKRREPGRRRGILGRFMIQNQPAIPLDDSDNAPHPKFHHSDHGA